MAKRGTSTDKGIHGSMILDPLPQNDFFGGVCFRPRISGTAIDTLIVHSTYIPAGVITPAYNPLPAVCNKAAARSLGEQWKASGDEALEFAALNVLIRSRRSWRVAAISPRCAERYL